MFRDQIGKIGRIMEGFGSYPANIYLAETSESTCLQLKLVLGNYSELISPLKCTVFPFPRWALVCCG